MKKNIIQGSCLCQKVVYELTGPAKVFQYCHCSRCRKFTGAAFAPNLIFEPHQLRWIKGEALVKQYAVAEAKHFSTAFCQNCGSSLPWISQSKKAVIVPAGTLDDTPEIEPIQNIFCDSKAPWYKPANELPEHLTLPTKSSSS